jgi:hypothetical protein
MPNSVACCVARTPQISADCHHAMRACHAESQHLQQQHLRALQGTGVANDWQLLCLVSADMDSPHAAWLVVGWLLVGHSSQVIMVAFL